MTLAVEPGSFYWAKRFSMGQAMSALEAGLARFLDAQGPVIETVRRELRAGRKQSHWMWFVFPQIAGLGQSPMSQLYSLRSLDEARAFGEHESLGARLRELTALALSHDQRSLHEIFGSPDDVKFVSCMTLFERAAPKEKLFSRALDRFCAGQRDPRTLAALDANWPPRGFAL